MPFQSEIDNAQKADSDALHTSSFLNPIQICIIAIPAFNEEIAIASVINRAKLYADTVIVVDDGSVDHTANVAESAGADVIRHLTNQGYGSALRTCFETARQRDADVLVTLDGDGQHNPDDIPRLLDVMQKTGADVVIGSRFLDNTFSQKIPRYRIFGMKLLDRVTMLGSGLKLTDSQSGFRAFSRYAIETIALHQEGMGATSEIIIRAAEKNLKIEETGISARYDGSHVSSKDPLSHGLDVIVSIIRIVSQKYPIWFFGIPGVVFLVAALALLLLTLEAFNVARDFNILLAFETSVSTVIGLFLCFIALLMWSKHDPTLTER